MAAPAARTGALAVAPAVVAVLVMVIWGATPIATRLALDGMAPLLVASLRTAIAGVLAMPLLMLGRQGLPADGDSRRLLAVSAVTGFVAFPIVYTIGQQRTSALHGVMILAALPIFTGGYAALVTRRRPGRWWLVGCAIAFIGEAILLVARSSGSGDSTLLGDLLILVAALGVSAGYVAGAMLPPRGFSSRATTFWGVALGAVILVPLAAGLLGARGVPDADTTSWGAVLFLAVLTSIVGYIGWYWALDRGGISRIATLQFLQPLSGFALAVLVLSEDVTLSIVVGGVAIVGGITVAQRS